MVLRKRTLDYKWIILILCFLMEFICLGFCSSNPGLYTKAVTEALQIKRSVYSLSTSIRYAVQVLVALNFGTLVGKFGIRKMALVGLASLTASVVVRALATHVIHIYIGCALWGLGTVFSGGTMASAIVRRWFTQDVGRYTGLVMSANGIGGAIAAQIISPMINNGTQFGYRDAYWLSAVLSFVIGAIVLIFLREHPAKGPVMQTAPGKKQPKGVLWAGLEYAAIRRKPYFYGAAVLVFLTGISLQSIGNITLVYMADIGMDAGFVAITATISSLCLTFSKVLVGITYDKKGLRATVYLCQGSALCCFLLFALLTDSPVGMVMAVIGVMLKAFALPIETVMIPLMANDLFGSTAYNKVLGVLTAMNSLGLCLGSPLGDLCFDIFGTYKPCFVIFSISMLGVMIAYYFVIRAANRDKQAILSR